MGEYLIDNNVISNYFTESFPQKAMNFISDVINKIPNISVITEIEALSWIAPDKMYETIIKEFIKDANILPLTKNVVTECVQIRRSRKIKTPDAIIAATAIVYDLTLITNDNDFKNIRHLQTMNPLDII
jgi:predicted nucleic acid-binding protein